MTVCLCAMIAIACTCTRISSGWCNGTQTLCWLVRIYAQTMSLLWQWVDSTCLRTECACELSINYLWYSHFLFFEPNWTRDDNHPEVQPSGLPILCWCCEIKSCVWIQVTDHWQGGRWVCRSGHRACLAIWLLWRRVKEYPVSLWSSSPNSYDVCNVYTNILVWVHKEVSSKLRFVCHGEFVHHSQDLHIVIRCMYFPNRDRV